MSPSQLPLPSNPDPQCVELLFPGILFLVLVLLHGLVDSEYHALNLGASDVYNVRFSDAATQLNSALNMDNGYIIGVTPPTNVSDIQAFFSSVIPADRFVGFANDDAIENYYNQRSYAVDPSIKSLLSTIHIYDFTGPNFNYLIRLNSVRLHPAWPCLLTAPPRPASR